jgi:hypothetical protein
MHTFSLQNIFLNASSYHRATTWNLHNVNFVPLRVYSFLILKNILYFNRIYLLKHPPNTSVLIRITSIRRKLNDTTYPYKFTAIFELPSRHFVMNATEAHENPYFAYSGHVVFKNEDGEIQPK